MEWEGIAIDRAHLAKLSAEMQQRIETAKRIHGARARFNLFRRRRSARSCSTSSGAGSPTCRSQAHADRQYKTDHDVPKLAAHTVPQLLLDWRQLTAHYVDSLPTLVAHDAACARRSTRPWRDRSPELRGSQPAEHPDPRRRTQGAAPRSWRVSLAGCCSRPTTRRSSCVSRASVRRQGARRSVPARRDIHARTAALVPSCCRTWSRPSCAIRRRSSTTASTMAWALRGSRPRRVSRHEARVHRATSARCPA